ncbi:FAD-dependent oxidoreductase [Kibdelosporangium phytohabitans]|uniref:FAD-binding monooxygenase n=1 Tax=Kibdelosporangium phytohabitans TaxID=860235 RepID=A0A0N7F3U2_9PSEU|nr:NAD(P)/FAD-dependent oxidoreductase [Kibdelosporangium phytohabitans]ALG09583.1 FAD-binding monooxygenase [Kibdelosporangium phytohabitans]MBE1469088.1 2-polyprenyl-6-methoxyphenol hydroxylase-like FAD-dependent oxidoreductase [Kibdelosporangium phytohabitans]
MVHVLIIGAGTGGMALAHGLRREGISVAVYERYRTRTDGLHGYRVGINSDGSRALRKLLPPELFDTFAATCAKPLTQGTMFTEKLSTVLELPFPDMSGQPDSERSVSRMTLRQVLLTGAEGFVHFDKEFTRYEQHDDGTVTAYFADGTSATGDLLVAADGTRSRVRQQYLPHAEIVDAGVISLAGKVPLTEQVRALLPAKMLRGTSMIFAPRGLFAITHVMEFPWDERGVPKQGAGSTDAELISRWPGLQFDNTRDYILWGVSAATPQLPGDTLTKRGKDIVETAKNLTPTWNPILHRLFDMSDPGSCFTAAIATSKPVPQWETTTVTLLGDAIHTMTPGRGAGANTALRDAALLCRKLSDVHHGKRALLDAVREYETKMIDYGFKAVADSLENQGGDNPLYKPVIGRTLLAGMRTAMRTANLFPPVRRKMAAGMLRDRGADRPED